MPVAPYKHCHVEYSVFGEGEGLVLVHGTGQSAENTWVNVAKHFSPRYKVVCPNYSGTGNTQDNNEALTVELLAGQVLAAADHAGLEQFSIAGHSLGTCVAMFLAATYPHRVKNVILLAGFIKTDDARSQLQFRMWQEMAKISPKLLAEMFLFTAFSPAFIATMSNTAVQETVETITASTNWPGAARQIDLDLRIDMTKEVQAIQQKTLVIGCQHDVIVPVSHAKELADAIQNATYAEMATGHAGCVENLEQFIAIVEDFLANTTN